MIIRNDMENLLRTIKRQDYKDYSIESELDCIEELGKMRSPDFVIDKYNREAYMNMIRWIHNDPAMTCLDPKTGETMPGRLNAGIFLAGGTGTGKSWLFDIMTVYAKILGVKVNFNGFIRGLTWTNVSVYKVCSNYVTMGDLSFYKDVDIIGFNDLGVEQIESVYMGNRLSVMKDVLESRGNDESKMTLITSNLRITSDILEQKYGKRVMSRLHAMCNYIELTGPDRRRIR